MKRYVPFRKGKTVSDAENSRASIGARRNPETEAAVLQAAAELIREQGYAALTMEAVCKRARAGKATLYRWWPSKAHLLLALYTRAKKELPEPDTGSLRGDIAAYLLPMLARWRGDDGEPLGPMLRLLVAEAQMDETVRHAMTEERHSRWHHLDRIVQRAKSRGELNPALPPRRIEQRIISLPWYLLLNDLLPTAAESSALVDDIIASLTA